MPGRRSIPIRFPAGGYFARVGFQKHAAQYFTARVLNVWPDGTATERERGGSRPGLGKSHATLLGSGNPIRLLTTTQYQSTAHDYKVKLLAVSNGTLYQESASGTMTAVTSDCTLATTLVLQSAEREGVTVIADDGAAVAEGTDGVIASGGTAFTSASVGDFAAAGADADEMLLVILSHTPINAVQTITISGSPTGGTWRAQFGDFATDPLAYNVSAADLQVALRALASIDGANVTVSGSDGGPYTVTFAGDFAGQEVALLLIDDADLTGGTDPAIAVTETTVGSEDVRWSGAWPITSIATTTITLTNTLRALTGITFRLQRAPKLYTAKTNTLSLMATSLSDETGEPLGFIPVGRPLVTLWRDRIVFAGGKYTPHLWEMSRQGDPADFDYGADPEDTGRAVAGQVSDAGQLGEPITAVIPHNNVCLIFGCTTSLWIMRGDPAFGGQIDRLSGEIGVLSANSWCYTPEDYLFFLSRDGIYMMAPGCGSTPQSVSRERLPRELINIDTTAYTVSMAYDVRYRGIHVFVTKNSAATGSHWFLDVKQTINNDQTSASFWPVQLASTDYDPFVVHARRNWTETYSWCILGGRDGYLRHYQHNLAADDGTAFTSRLLYGPLRASSNDFLDGTVHDLTGELPEDSGPINYAVQVGETAEGAVSADACASGTWRTAGLQYSDTIRRRGRYFCVELSGTGESWETEGLFVTASDEGRQRKA